MKHFTLCKVFRVNFDWKMKIYEQIARDVGVFTHFSGILTSPKIYSVQLPEFRKNYLHSILKLLLPFAWHAKHLLLCGMTILKFVLVKYIFNGFEIISLSPEDLVWLAAYKCACLPYKWSCISAINSSAIFSPRRKILIQIL